MRLPHVIKTSLSRVDVSIPRWLGHMKGRDEYLGIGQLMQKWLENYFEESTLWIDNLCLECIEWQYQYEGGMSVLEIWIGNNEWFSWTQPCFIVWVWWEVGQWVCYGIQVKMIVGPCCENQPKIFIMTLSELKGYLPTIYNEMLRCACVWLCGYESLHRLSLQRDGKFFSTKF